MQHERSVRVVQLLGALPLAMDLTPTHTGCFPDSAVNIIGYTSTLDAIFVTDQEL